MSSKYRYYGPLGNTYKQRDFKQWVLVFSDGDELTLSRKRYAVMVAKSVMQRGGSIRIYEETVMRTIFANDDEKDESFRIEITERVKLEMETERINK